MHKTPKRLFIRLTKMCVQNKLFKKNKKNEQQRHFFLLMTIKQRQCVYFNTLNWNMYGLFNTRRKNKTKEIENWSNIKKKLTHTHTHAH
jgi:hypothetical protein